MSSIKLTHILIAVSVVGLFAGTIEASATNYVYGGYHDRSGLNKATEVFGYTRFDESTGSPDTNDWVLSVLSTAGWESGSDPNEHFYQAFWNLDANDEVYTGAEAWHMGTKDWTGTSTDLTTRTGHTYLYAKMYFSNGDIKYDFTAGLTGGGVATHSTTYDPDSYSDGVDKFLAGTTSKTIGLNTNEVRFMQFDIESNEDELNSVKVRQYSMGYKESGSLKYLSSYDARTAEYPNGNNDEGTWITYSSTQFAKIGQADMTKTKADCKNTFNCSSTLSTGIVRWSEGTHLGNDKKIWP